jgi:hypothetical protein
MTDRLRLLAIVAHPDDESLGVGGLLAQSAAEPVAPHLLTAPRGERGWNAANGDAPGTLPGTLPGERRWEGGVRPNCAPRPPSWGSAAARSSAIATAPWLRPALRRGWPRSAPPCAASTPRWSSRVHPRGAMDLLITAPVPRGPPPPCLPRPAPPRPTVRSWRPRWSRSGTPWRPAGA